MPGLYETLTAAVADFIENGFDSQQRLDHWLAEIERSIAETLIPEAQVSDRVRTTLEEVFRRMVDRGGLLQRHPGADRFTLMRVAPALRAERDRRIVAATDLIKLDREQAVARTLQRFRAWSTSIPPGGTGGAARVEVKTNVKKSLASLPYVERRLAIDQGAKLVANLSEILAVDGGALAGEWRHIKPRIGYQSRPEHLARDGKFYAVRDNWAIRQGLMRVGPHGYTDEITRPGEEIFCSCHYRYLHALRDLPDSMLTTLGRAELARVRSVA